jgi:two-component system chemotaxis response regulator CheY
MPHARRDVFVPMAHCLIVDDSRVIRTVARRIFEELHFVAVEAEDGMAALRACREKMPDLILLDWCMPGMTGVDLVRSLRAQTDGDQPVILISATEIDATEIAHAVAAGVDDYLMKPFDRETLSAKLAELRPHRAPPLASLAVI